MKKTHAILVAILATFAASQVLAQAAHFDSTVAAVSPSGTGTQVALLNGQSAYCEPEPGGLLAKLCPLLQPGQLVSTVGEFASDDSDLGSLGWWPVTEMSFEDGGPIMLSAPDTWTWNGCIVDTAPNGFGWDIELNSGQTSRIAYCGPDGTLGSLCQFLAVGDCGFFEGAVPGPDSDLFPSGRLDLKSLTADNSVPDDPDDRPCHDCDGR